MYDKAAFQQIVLWQLSLNLIMHLFYINWTTIYLHNMYVHACNMVEYMHHDSQTFKCN